MGVTTLKGGYKRKWGEHKRKGTIQRWKNLKQVKLNVKKVSRQTKLEIMKRLGECQNKENMPTDKSKKGKAGTEGG